jgi:hypothetical protein
MRRALIALALLAFSIATAFAGVSTFTEAKIASTTVYTSGGSAAKGYLVVTFTSNGVGTPGCASGYPRNIVIDLSTDGGKFAATVFAKAEMLGSAITATGTGMCSVIPTAETLLSVQETPRVQ